jgi:hypothetical protein
MKSIKGIGPAFRKAVRNVCAGAGVLAAIWLIAVTWTSVMTLSKPSQPGSRIAQAHGDAATSIQGPQVAAMDSPAWGSEALSTVREQAFALAPLSVANACGLGASSCFKCHNGTRAPAAKMDHTTAPWHTDHMHVNDDCVGCHAGNPRIIKKDLAHTGLQKDPRANVAACAKCHQTGNAATLLKSYQVAAAGGK